MHTRQSQYVILWHRCSELICENGGKPYKVDDECECDCAKPWGGYTCNINLHDEASSQVCLENKCLNNGVCIPDQGLPEGMVCRTADLHIP